MSYDYVIVEFTDLSCQCIPTNWLSECKLFCSYPNVSSFKINDLVKRKVIPSNDKSWERFDVRILGYADSYEQGRRKAAKAEFTSSLDTDDDRGYRKRRTRAEVHSSSPDSTPPTKKNRQQLSRARNSRTKNIKPSVLFPVQKQPPLPLDQSEGLQGRSVFPSTTHLHSPHQGTSVTTNVPGSSPGFCLAPGSGTGASSAILADTPSVLQIQVEPAPFANDLVSNDETRLTPSDTNQTVPESAPRSSTNPTELSDFQKTVLRALSTIQRDIRNLYEITSQRSTYQQPTDVLPVSLPINSREDFLKINEWLVQQENRSKLCDILRLIGGETKESVVRNILVRLIGPVLNRSLNWSGKFQKLKLKETNLHFAIIDSVRHNPIAQDITDEEVKRTIKTWLSGLKDRDGGRERRRNEVRQNREEEN